MNSLKEIYRMLAALKLYRLNGRTMVDHELAAYETGFAPLEEKLSQLVPWAFAQMATGTGLERWERLLALAPAGAEEDRRQAVVARLSPQPEPTAAGLTAALQNAGFEAYVADRPGSFALRVICPPGLSDEAAKRITAIISRLAPAHLTVMLTGSEMNWAYFNACDYTFSSLDSRGFTWLQAESAL